MGLPNCYYCGKFVNPTREGVVTDEVFDYYGPVDLIFYHWECKEPGEKKRSELIKKLNQPVNK